MARKRQLSKERRIVKQLQRYEPKTPIATDYFLPNHSGIASHPEFKEALAGVTGLWEVDGTETQLITADEIDMQDKAIININSLKLGTAEGNSRIYFYEGGSPTAEYIMWDDTGHRFEISDDLQCLGNVISQGDIYTTGAGDDLWLGNSTQGSASFQAYANGNLTATGTSTLTNITTTNRIKSMPQSWDKTLLDPNGIWDIDTQVPITTAEAALKVTRVKVDLNTTGKNVWGDLKYADNLSSFTNATLIRAFDTSSGVLDATGLSIAVPSGKEVYIQFDSQSDSTITFMALHIEWDFD